MADTPLPHPEQPEPTPLRKFNPWQRLGIALAVTTLVVVTLVSTAGLWLRAPLNHMISQRLNREFRITGPLTVHPWQLRPEISAEGLELANVPGGKAGLLASVGRLSVSVDLPALLDGRLELPTLELDKARIQLEEDAAGQGNWVFGTGGGGRAVRLGAVRVRESLVTADLPSSATRFDLAVATDEAAQQLNISVSGTWRGEVFSVKGEAGSVGQLAAGGQPYPVKAGGTIGATQFAFDGAARNLADLDGLDVHFNLNGRNLADLYRIAGVPLPPTPGYRMTAHLVRDGGEWRFSQIDGRVGRSDITGDLTVDRRRALQELRGDLHSARLDLADLSGFIGARGETGEKIAPRPGKVLPNRPLGFEKIAAADVDIVFAAADIRHTDLPIESASGHLHIADRQVTLDNLKIGLARGQVSGKIGLDMRRAPAGAQLDLTASRLSLRALMPQIDSKNLTTGSLGGRAALAMHGISVAELLGSADGELTLAMDGGSVSRLLVRLANLDVANAIGAWLAGGKKEDIRCLVGDMTARQGVLEPRTLFLDTQRMLIRGEGSVSLHDETLDLHLRATPKDSSLVALRGPLRVSGTFAEPKIGPEALPLTGRLAGSVILGIVAPPLALVPLIETGSVPDSACGRYLHQARKAIARPAAGSDKPSAQTAPTANQQ